MYPLLDTINSPSDLKQLSDAQLRQLCTELRDYMVHCCAVTPGHLGASLGAVEIIVGLHRVFDTPNDKIVFDVGHQAYAHKILTGRREAFRKLRTRGGISGFPRREESPYDAFGAGHSSTSISAALGFAEAARLRGSGEKAIAVIGDGALTGGLAFEGMNNAGASNADLLVVLNDNNQSIDRNLGGMHDHLLRITTSIRYNRFKDQIWDFLGERRFRGIVQRWLRGFKSWLVKKTGGDIFEALGFRYFGPVDGNDIGQILSALERLRDLHGPRILHCITTKGKGYAPAEADPVTWHAPGRFDPQTGERIKGPRTADRYQDVFGEVLCQLAEQDRRVVGVTPAMASGCGMNLLAERFPKRFFDVGIEEEHAVTFSAGLAAGGLRPFCNIYSSFSQRAYDNIIHDVALQRLPVTICLDRAGLVGEDGATHHGCFDLAAYRSVPDTVLCAPRDEIALKRLMYTSLHSETGPFIIRYPRGMGEGRPWREAAWQEWPAGKAETLLEGDSIALIAIGPVANRALEAARDFDGKVGVYDFCYLKPLDEERLSDIASRYRHIITLEDGALKGGLYSAVCEALAGQADAPTVEGLGIPDRFIRHARQEEQREECGLDTRHIKERIQEVLRSF